MCEAYRRLVRRLFEEVVNQGNLAVIDTIYAPNVVDRNILRGQACGRVSIRRALMELRTILLDLHVAIDELRTETDTVITRETWSGTHAFTGKQMQGTITHIFRIHDGKIVEEWSGGWAWLDEIGI